jgi:hypothetical protein
VRPCGWKGIGQMIEAARVPRLRAIRWMSGSVVATPDLALCPVRARLVIAWLAPGYDANSDGITAK